MAAAKAIWAQKQLDRAVEALARAETLCPALKPRPKLPLIALLERWLTEVRAQGKLDSATFLARSLAVLDPTRARQQTLATALEEVGRYAEAKPLLVELAAQGAKPDAAKALAARIARCEKKIAWQERRKLGQATRLRAETYARLALDARERRRWKQAGELFAKSHQLYPHPLLLLQAGRVLDELGQAGPARRAYARALALAEQRRKERTVFSPALGHAGDVNAVVFSPDGRSYVSGSSDGTIKVWDRKTLRELRTLGGHNGSVTSLAIDPRGRVLASGSSDRTVTLWDLQSGQKLRSVTSHRLGVNAVAIGPRGQILASGGLWTVKLWNLRSGKALRTLSGHRGWVRSVAIGPRGRVVASGSADATVRVWDLQSGKELRRLAGHFGGVDAVAIGPRGRILASGSRDKSVKVWDLRSGRELRTLTGHVGWVTSVAIGPRGRILVSSSEDKTVKVWDLQSGKELRTLRGHGNWVRSVAIGSRGRALASSGSDQTVRLWDLQTGRELRTREGHGNPVYTVAIDPRGQVLASASEDKIVKLWDLQRGGEPRSLRGHERPVNFLAIGPRGRVLASVAFQAMKHWDVRSGREQGTRRVPGMLPGDSMAIGSLGRVLAARARDKSVGVWDPSSGQLLRTLGKQKTRLASVAIDPRGQILASGSEDGTVVFWDPQSGQELREPPLAIGRGGRVRAVGGRVLASEGLDKTVTLWDLRTGKVLCSIKTHQSEVTSLAIGPRDGFLVTSSTDGTIKLWQLPSGRPLATLISSTTGDWIVFTPDGYVDASKGARWLVQWRVGTQHFYWHLAWERYHVPGLLARVVKGDEAFRLTALRALVHASKNLTRGAMTRP